MASERQRMTCKCGYAARMTIWCTDPACCDPDLASFLAALLAEEHETGLPTYAARFLDADPGVYLPDRTVRAWRAGNVVPVYTGPIGDAPAVLMRHDCPAGEAITRT